MYFPLARESSASQAVSLSWWTDLKQGLALEGWRTFGGINSFVPSVGLRSLKWDPADWLAPGGVFIRVSPPLMGSFTGWVCRVERWHGLFGLQKRVRWGEPLCFWRTLVGSLLLWSLWELSNTPLAGGWWPPRPSAPCEQEHDLNCS